VRGALAHAKGTIEAMIVDGSDGPLLRYVLRFPTLTEARRRESDSAA
jgi:spermidine synthase